MGVKAVDGVDPKSYGKPPSERDPFPWEVPLPPMTPEEEALMRAELDRFVDPEEITKALIKVGWTIDREVEEMEKIVRTGKPMEVIAAVKHLRILRNDALVLSGKVATVREVRQGKGGGKQVVETSALVSALVKANGVSSRRNQDDDPGRVVRHPARPIRGAPALPGRSEEGLAPIRRDAEDVGADD